MTTATDPRIESLTREIDRLRKGCHLADNQQQQLLLKVTEIQLNLAVQDRTLGKLELSVNGNGKPGLMSRVDRLESIATTLTRTVWLLITAAVTATARFLFHHWG